MDLRAQAERWLAEDPDPQTRAELAGLIERSDEAGIVDRFSGQLAFGTAGIRGPLGAGPNRMNRAVVRRVTAGLAARLRAADPDAAARGLVLGQDARHGSEEFAFDAAAVLAGAGIGVRCFDEPVPTPLVAFAVRALGAGGGVQITASHNPASDNGYKIYGPDGAQIAPPADAEIVRAMDGIESLDDVPFAAGSPLIRPVPPKVREAYLDAAAGLALHPEHRDLSIVYTPLHGVAGELCAELLDRAGFTDVRTVPAQADPDPDFPTVAFPNPELPGVLDLALGLAGEVGADLVLANDPDGDRIAAAVPGPPARLLTGDEVGCLLAEYLLASGGGGPERVVATTVVSSRLLARIAEAHGVGYAETLTGFKWLAGVAERARAEGGRLVLAYEQALGVMVGDAVRDKDGISAALVLAELAAWLKARGRTPLDALDDLARRFGVHATAGWSVRLEGARGAVLVGETLDRLRTAPPAAVDGIPVVVVADHVEGVRRHADGAAEPLTTPRADLVGLELADGCRLQIRPSGTEPLLKLYAEVVEPVVGGDVPAARVRAGPRLDALAGAFQQLAFPS
ncbi:MAG: phospho-sugar mutase [Egibacteraceae bacterium]